MAATQFDATVRQDGDRMVIDLSGDIDRGAGPALSAAYEQTGGQGTVVLNFERVTYINSTGIALIVGLLARARKAQREVHAAGLSPHYREIFEITRLSDFMAIV